MLPLLPGGSFDAVQTVDSVGLAVERPWKPPPAAAAATTAPAMSAASPSAAAATASAAGAAGAGSGAAAAAASPSPASLGASATPETVLVVFVGGVTFAEVSALRLLEANSQASPQPVRFLVLATRIVNGRTLLQPFVDPLVAAASSAGAA